MQLPASLAFVALKENTDAFTGLCPLSNLISTHLCPSAANVLFPNPHEAGSISSFISQLNVELVKSTQHKSYHFNH